MKHGNKFRDAIAKVDREALYEPEEALALVKETAFAGFDETVELSIRLGVDPRHADQQVRGAIVLPGGTGKQVRVLVFAEGEKASEAEEAGADFVGSDDLVGKIQGGWLDFDVAIATPDMMSKVGRLGRILGPRGLMPNPKSGTVTFDLNKAVSEVKAGRIEYRTDKAGLVNVPMGKVSFSVEDLMANFRAIIDALLKAKPAAAKGQYMRAITVASTMGPGVKVNPQKAVALVKA